MTSHERFASEYLPQAPQRRMARRRRQGGRLRARDRPRHDARPHRCGRGRRREVRRRGHLPLRPARFDIDIERRRHQGARREDPLGKGFTDRLGRRAGVVPHRQRRWRSTTASAPDQIRHRRCAQGLPHRPHASARSASGRTASSASTPQADRRDWDADPEGNTKQRIAETFRKAATDRRGRTANASPPRAKSAGAACTPGGRWSTFSNA